MSIVKFLISGFRTKIIRSREIYLVCQRYFTLLYFNRFLVSLFINRVMYLCAVCNQFARGVFAMLGAVNPESFDTLHSYTNTFQMPFVTPWFPEKVSFSILDINNCRAEALSLKQPKMHQAFLPKCNVYSNKQYRFKSRPHCYSKNSCNLFSVRTALPLY